MLKKLLGMKWWIIAVLLCAIGIPFMAYQKHGATKQYRDNRATYCAAFMSSEDQKIACEEEKASADDYLQWGYELFEWPDGITAWAIIATGFAIAWQSSETRKAAKTSRDAIILQHRPKIVVRSLALVQHDSGTFDIKLVIRNSGATKAHIAEWQFDILWLKAGDVKQTHTENISAATLAGGEQRKLTFTAPEFYVRFGASRLILEENVDQEQEVSLGCVALIPYKDEIGTDRETAISRLYLFRQKDFVLSSSDRERDYSD